MSQEHRIRHIRNRILGDLPPLPPLTVKQLAQVAGVSADNLYHQLSAGECPFKPRRLSRKGAYRFSALKVAKTICELEGDTSDEAVADRYAEMGHLLGS